MNRKLPTEKEIIEQLSTGKVSLPPLSFRFLKRHPKLGENRPLDALIELTWKGSKARFAVECKSLSTPKVFQDGLNLLKCLVLPKGYWPMLITPFLSEQQLQELEREGISGLDLCGNGVVVVSNKLYVYRSGSKNRFSSSAPIKNIYRKKSSMVGRVFLVGLSFKSVKELCAEINQRNPLVNRWDSKPISLSTVSKALKTLQEDLIVEREGVIRLIQPDKLLETLSENYLPPKINNRIRLKVTEGRETIQELLKRQSQELDLPIVASGTSSVTQYAVMQRGEIFSIYCPRLDLLIERLPGSQSDRFPNLELIETTDENIYFDVRQNEKFWWSSPVQVYLELMTGDKRDRETAEQVKSFLMTNPDREQQ